MQETEGKDTSTEEVKKKRGKYHIFRTRPDCPWERTSFP